MLGRRGDRVGVLLAERSDRGMRQKRQLRGAGPGNTRPAVLSSWTRRGVLSSETGDSGTRGRLLRGLERGMLPERTASRSRGAGRRRVLVLGRRTVEADTE